MSNPNPNIMTTNSTPATTTPSAHWLRPIPETFERNQTYTYELIWRDGPYAIYRYHFIPSDLDPPLWRYEAVIIRIKPPHPQSPDRRYVERLPGNGDWGLYGWSFNTLEQAQKQIKDVKELRGEKIESRYRSDFNSLSISFNSLEDLEENTTLPTGRGCYV